MTTAATENKNLETRVLVLMPTGRDAALVCAALENVDIAAEVCRDAPDIETKIAAGAGAILIAEEALQNGALERLVEIVNRQPIWSDVPVVLFASNAQNSEKLLAMVGTRLNATIVERPIRITMLVSAARGALRARERQFQARDLLEELKQADRQKDLFLATLSHELRTPLNSMLGWIKLLRSESGSGVDASHGLDVIERNARTQAEMISDILFVSRVITGKLELKLETADLTSIIETAIDIVRPAVEAKKIQLTSHLDFKQPQITGDADRLQQVFLNLLSNAIKFTPKDGRIDVRAANRDSTLEIEICDSGQGIKSEFLPFVFERFRQADNSYTRQIGGLGLGLAIVRHLVELHGGTVKVSSDGENCGSVFTVSLPAAARAEQQPTSEKNPLETSPPIEESLDGVRVLLVEDDEDSREMLKVLFGQYSIKVIAVGDAAKALESIRNTPPDVLISDVGLPGEDGYQLIRKVRELAPEKGGLVPAIALTGYASLQDRSQAINAGFQEHLSKPVDMDKLIDLVKDLVSRGGAAESKLPAV